MKVTSFRELMNGHAEAEIFCIYSGKLVRKLRLVAAGENVHVLINAMAGPIVEVPELTPIDYEPWVFDRGNMTFSGDATRLPEFAGKTLKICGEEDRIVYGDGTKATINP